MEKPWVTKSAVPIAARIAPMATVLLTPGPVLTTPCSRLLAPRSLCEKPRKETTAQAITSSTRKMPVSQAFARRSSRPATVAAIITAAPAIRGSTLTIGARYSEVPMAISEGTIMTTIRDWMNTSQPANRPARVPTIAYSPPALGIRVPSSE